VLSAVGTVTTAPLQPVAFSRIAVVKTDKTDYRPGETAAISGAGFRPGESLTLKIVHTDGTAEGGMGDESWYAKGDDWRFERDAVDRIPYMAPGLVGPERASRGKLPTDVWWMTIVPPASSERTGYPTQKPLRLLERIVAASSRPGDLVLDPFAGSGTTGAAAARLGRRWLLVDRNPVAVEIARARLAAEGERSGA